MFREAEQPCYVNLYFLNVHRSLADHVLDLQIMIGVNLYWHYIELWDPVNAISQGRDLGLSILPLPVMQTYGKILYCIISVLLWCSPIHFLLFLDVHEAIVILMLTCTDIELWGLRTCECDCSGTWLAYLLCTSNTDIWKNIPKSFSLSCSPIHF